MYSPNLKRAIGIILTLTVVGCATTGVENVKELPANHKIAIFSALGDKLAIKTTGTTTFQNWESSNDVSDWNVDEFVGQSISQRLAESGRFNLVSIDTPAIRNVIKSVGTNFWTGGPEAQGDIKALRQEAALKNAESILLVGTVALEDPFFGTNQTISGFGIYQRSFLGTKQGINFAIVHVWLIDVQTGKDFAKSLGRVGSSRSDTDWLEQNQQISDEYLERTRSQLETVINSATSEALRRLSLVDS